ncbi:MULTISPECIES: restriction endonuclease [Modicisalibacter]|uniref:Restriction endonuclease n=1 Tax=Modicisalibacter tunisiensis TaxID=390637 RepID=A0ABS7WVZ3_9GAMM|nr:MULTISPECIES: restriction endonuclease [Modicisalibacter]MBZ9566770.1 restriction endonuclease [Modicisalibacter tunisiensis]
MSRVVMVRSPLELTAGDQAGYGWSQMNFSEHASADSLMKAFRDRGIEIGRKGNQIRRFFNIRAGDLIVVPVPRAILLARATGEKGFGLDVGYGENRIGATFLRDPDGKVKRIPRDDLSTALETRLKIRMAVASLDEFSDELETLYSRLESGGFSNINSQHEAENSEAVNTFKKTLLERIQQGSTFLAGGGNGLEMLVMELLKLEGYEVRRPSKRHYEGVADADIEAYRKDRFNPTKLLVQVKHHQGTTGAHGIRQLAALDDDDAQRWLITTAIVDEGVEALAEKDGIQVMGGNDFSDWLFEHWQNLSVATRSRLGLSDAPVLL